MREFQEGVVKITIYGVLEYRRMERHMGAYAVGRSAGVSSTTIRLLIEGVLEIFHVKNIVEGKKTIIAQEEKLEQNHENMYK